MLLPDLTAHRPQGTAPNNGPCGHGCGVPHPCSAGHWVPGRSKIQLGCTRAYTQTKLKWKGRKYSLGCQDFAPQLMLHLHLACLCKCVCRIQGNTFLYVLRRTLRFSQFQVVPALRVRGLGQAAAERRPRYRGGARAAGGLGKGTGTRVPMWTRRRVTGAHKALSLPPRHHLDWRRRVAGCGLWAKRYELSRRTRVSHAFLVTARRAGGQADLRRGPMAKVRPLATPAEEVSAVHSSRTLCSDSYAIRKSCTASGVHTKSLRYTLICNAPTYETLLHGDGTFSTSNVGGWRLAVGGWWRLAVGGAGWRLAVGGPWGLSLTKENLAS